MKRKGEKSIKETKKNLQSFYHALSLFSPFFLSEIRGEWQLLGHNNESTGWEKRDCVASGGRTGIGNKMLSKSCGKEVSKINVWAVRSAYRKFASLLTRYINPNVSGSSWTPNFILQYPLLQNVVKLFFLSKGKTFMLSSAQGMKKPLLCIDLLSSDKQFMALWMLLKHNSQYP